MMRYEFLGGGQVTGATNKELAENMWNSSFDPPATLEEFMKEVAERCQMQRGSDVRYDTVDNFINDLITNEFLVKV